MNGIHEVGGSIPPGSTKSAHEFNVSSCALRATLESIFSGSMEQGSTRVVLSRGRESRGRVPRQFGEGRMSYIFFILAMGPMSAAGIYSPQVTHHNRCIVEPGTFDALYCPAPAAPPAHPHHKK